MAEKECEYCGEVYQVNLFFNFSVDSNDGTHTAGVMCADCMATWFSETPEDVKNMMVWKEA